LTGSTYTVNLGSNPCLTKLNNQYHISLSLNGGILQWITTQPVEITISIKVTVNPSASLTQKNIQLYYHNSDAYKYLSTSTWPLTNTSSTAFPYFPANTTCGYSGGKINFVAGSNPPNITATKTSNIPAGSTVKEGDIITYTIEVFNNGNAADNVIITDNIPANTIYVGENGSTSSPDPSKRTVTKNIGSMGASSVYRYSFSVKVGTINSNTTISNTATITATGVSPISTNTVNTSAIPSRANLNVTKTSSVASGASVKEGDYVEYTITIRNTGNASATNVVLTDNIPANTTYVEKNGSSYTPVPSKRTITENIGTIAAGSSYTYKFTVVIGEIAANTTIQNTASVTADGISSISSNTLSFPAVISTANITLTKTSNVSSVKGGERITYKIVARNSGTGTVRNVVIHDNIPTHTTYIDPSTGSPNATKTSVDSPSKASLAPGETYEFSFTVVVDNLKEATTIENTATATCTNSSGVTSNKVTVSVAANLPDLSITKTSSIANGSSVKEGDIIDYTITIKNNGSANATNVVLTDNIPANTTYVEKNGSTYTPIPTKRTITENIGTLAGGASHTYTFSVVVEEITANTNIQNIANISADGIEPISSNNCTISAVTSSPNVTLTKKSNIANGSKVKSGEQITYTITARNDGDGIAKNVVIRDKIPKNTTFLDKNTGNLDSSKTEISSPVKAILRPGETYEVTFTVVVNQLEEPTTIENAATVNCDNGSNGTSNKVEISATPNFPILRVEKKSSISDGAIVKEGNKITYTITVFNDGYTPATNVIIKDTIPENTIYYDTTTNTADPSKLSVASAPKDSLAPGESYSFEFTVVVGKITANTTIRNTAKVASDDLPDVSSNTNGITAEITVPDLSAEKTSSIATGSVVKEGDLIIYTITVHNNGTSPAYDVSISDTVPQYTTLYENNQRVPEKRDVGKTIPILNAGESDSYSFTVIVDEIPENTVIKNTGKVTGENSPDIPTNTVGVTAEPSVPTLRVEKTSSITEGMSIKSGDVITYTITVFNDGEAIAHNVVISDNVPEHTIYAERIGSEYKKDTSKTSVSKTIDTLLPGESESLTFSVIVDTLNANTVISNTAKVNAKYSPEIPSNSLGITAKPKDNQSGGKLPYAGHYSIIIGLTIVTLSIGGFTFHQYQKRHRFK